MADDVAPGPRPLVTWWLAAGSGPARFFFLGLAVATFAAGLYFDVLADVRQQLVGERFVTVRDTAPIKTTTANTDKLAAHPPTASGHLSSPPTIVATSLVRSSVVAVLLTHGLAFVAAGVNLVFLVVGRAQHHGGSARVDRTVWVAGYAADRPIRRRHRFKHDDSAPRVDDWPAAGRGL